ncbi:MAG: hypothetical protein CMF49_05785 [Legionellales bacterium]|nr:hypothetical protein [Legionellales bacterium]
MRKFLPAVFLATVSSTVFAAASPVVPVTDYPKQNKINYQLSVSQWVNTQTAKVTVSINASLDQKSLQDIQQVIDKNLKGLANVNWRMINFTRNQSESGLESVMAVAQARIPTGQITDIRGKAKDLSKPGIKYQISDIDYSPTEAELQQALVSLRGTVYQKVKTEIDLLDKTFGNEDYYIQNIRFYSGAMPNGYANNRGNMMMKAVVADTAPSNANVSQKVQLNADVTIASTVAAD